MRSTRVLVACLLMAVIGAGTAAAGGGQPVSSPPLVPKNAAAARALKEQDAAYALINRATRRIAAVRRSCRFDGRPTALPDTHDTPSQPVLDLIASLRRPASAADALPAGSPLLLGFGATYVDYVRRATAANGQRFSIVIARSVRPSFRISAACLDAEHAELLRLLRGKPRRLRSVTLHAFSTVRQGQERNSEQPTTPQDGIYLFTRNANGSGGGGGGGDAGWFATHGIFVSHGGSGHGAQLDGLVPDGVASVTLEYPKRVGRGRYYKPAEFPSAFSRTVRVRENVLSVRVPRDAGDAFPARMVWRAADGSVLRIVKRP